MHKNFIFKNWDSQFFNRTIFTLELPIVETKSNTWPTNSLLTAKVSAKNYLSLDEINKYDFSFIEGEIAFQKKLPESNSPVLLSSFNSYLATESSIDELKSIVDNLYINSRFREPWFSPTERDCFYKIWIENAVLSKFDDCCLVLKNEGNISGFVTIRIRNNDAVIGLIGVASRFQGLGVGSKLLKLIEAYCLANNVGNIKVATQTSNTAAANLYSKNGFSIADISYWFYKQV